MSAIISALYWLAVVCTVIYATRYISIKVNDWLCISNLRRHTEPKRNMTNNEKNLIESLTQHIVLRNEELARTIRPTAHDIYIIEGSIKRSATMTFDDFESCTLGKIPVKLHRSLQGYISEENIAEIALSKRSATVLKLNGHEIQELSSDLLEREDKSLPTEHSTNCAKWNPIAPINMAMLLTAICLIFSIHLLASSTFGFRILPKWSTMPLLGITTTLALMTPLTLRDRRVRINLKANGIQFIDEAPGYHRNDFLHASDIKSIHIYQRLLFRTLTINMKNSNQRYFLCSAMIDKEFLQDAKALIKRYNS